MAAVETLEVDQGADWSTTITWTDSSDAAVNLTGYTADMQVRQAFGATAIMVELTTSNGHITTGGTAGTVALSLPASVTTGLSAGNYVYDLKMTSGSTAITRLLEGRFIVNAAVTR